MCADVLVAVPIEHLGAAGPDAPQPVERHVSNFYYYGADHTPSIEPQGFFVSRDPNKTTRAHFHHVDQYQIFFGVPGATFQRHEIGTLLHYTDAETVYGPFSSGENGLRFMTLRRHGVNFTGYMPESRDQLLASKTRVHHEAELDEWLDDPLPVAGEMVREEIFGSIKDGIGAVRISAGSKATINAVEAENSGGQYYVVMSGSAEHEGSSFPRFSVGWVGPYEKMPDLVAGLDGVLLLVLQFAIRD